MRKIPFALLNRAVDISEEFAKFENIYFHADRITRFDAETLTGWVHWGRYALKTRLAFNQYSVPFEPSRAWEFPPVYPEDLVLPLRLDFINPRTLRLRLSGKTQARPDPPLMLNSKPGVDRSWEKAEKPGGTIYRHECGSLHIHYDPLTIELKDRDGRLLTKTHTMQDYRCLINSDPTPLTLVRRVRDLKRNLAISFALTPDEKIFGCGESFTRLNKRGQKLVLWTKDAHGTQSDEMYKPVPFFISNRGYGMFVHTSVPITFDFGRSYDEETVIYTAEDFLDLFIFIGSPKEILSEYTRLTGRSPLPPLWSFGLWMSRITYQSETETREVGARLRKYRIPCDVIHLDTGWFDEEWRCNYEFSTSRFPRAEQMIDDLRREGLRISVWQLPYFTPKNPLYQEAIQAGYVVRDADGQLPTDDAILDFSNPQAVIWYQKLLEGLFAKGVAAIKVDFGESAPLHGIFHSGRSGLYEHNLYPLRYNKAVADLTRAVKGKSVIWARSAWAGSQRYPLHWGGDAENTDCSMAATLRAGLSFGLSGFSFWSHDIGGFVKSSPEELYRRWLPFGMLTSHSRCHGAPPTEPWEYSPEFLDDFRRSAELKYRLLPYVYAQAAQCSQTGYPMLRTLFFEYPEDQTAWLVEDEYLFGNSILVAPLMEAHTVKRAVYLPAGEQWIDYQTHKVYPGGQWHRITAGKIPIVMLVREGSMIPHIPLAQSTDWLDWGHLELVVFAARADTAIGLICLPNADELQTITLQKQERGFVVIAPDLPADWRIRLYDA
jgi:alpha-D-xyloside xylohydrolase